jgi:ankyrin repeat protein
MLPVVGSCREAVDQRWLLAVTSNRVDVLEELITVIADVDRSTATGKTALMAAASRGATSLVHALIEAGAAVGARNQGAGTALTYAAGSGQGQTLQLLIDRGADVNSQSNNGWTALMMAAAKDRPEAARQLLGAGARADLADVYAWTPLMRAAYEGHSRVVEVLLQAGDPHLEQRNDQGQTVLHVAVIGEHPDIVARLLQQGAKPAAIDDHGRTPTEIAEMTHQASTTVMLRDATSQH